MPVKPFGLDNMAMATQSITFKLNIIVAEVTQTEQMVSTHI